MSFKNIPSHDHNGLYLIPIHNMETPLKTQQICASSANYFNSKEKKFRKIRILKGSGAFFGKMLLVRIVD